MNISLKAKLIQHLISKKKGNEGFTLIELLVVIIIIGILAAIALPSFLNQANKARQTEAQTYVSAINRGQQAYFLENNAFGDTIANLGIGIPEETKSYTFEITVGAADTAGATVEAESTNTNLKGVAGRAFIIDASGGDKTTTAVLCMNPTADGTAPNVSAVTSNAGCP